MAMYAATLPATALNTPCTAPTMPGNKVVCVENLIRLHLPTEIVSNSAATPRRGKGTNGAFMNMAKPIKLIVCWLAAIAILLPAMAWAETDCQYPPLKKSRPTPIMTANAAGVVCAAEIATGVGAIVWEVRRKMDGYIAGNFARYCVEYSMYCPHYAWQKGCYCRHYPSACRK